MEQTHVKTAPTKERSNMVNARIAARLTQKQVAKKMEVSLRSIINWENAHTTPQLSQLEGLRDAIKFTGTDEELLHVFLVEKLVEEPDQEPYQVDNCQQLQTSQQLSPPCQSEPNRAILESTDPPFIIHIPRSVRGFREFMDIVRRQFIEVVAKFGLTASFGHLSLGLVASPSVDPEDYLALVEASIGTWWQWLYQGNYHELEKVLLRHVLVLKRLAYIISPFQGNAAELAAQAKFMQILLATFNLQFSARKNYCVGAVELGALSGDRNLHAIALYWQGDTFTYCYHQPKKAICHLNNALSHVDGSALIRSAIYSNLSIAHAQDEDETNAAENEEMSLKYAEMARLTLPTCPELDPYYRFIDVGEAELDQFEGKARLYLAERTHNRKDAELARDAFDKSISKQATRDGLLGQAYIRRADAARVLGDMDGLVKDLTEGLGIAIEFRYQDNITHARNIIGQVPSEWLHETAIQDLQKNITNAIQELQKQISNPLVVAHR
jgi:transcriptional regulator with XRE-family HTH domain